MDNNRGNIGRNALEIFKALWNGTGDASDKYLDSEFIPAESCGCPNTGRVDYRNYIKNIIKGSVAREQEEDAVMILQKELEECNEYYDLFERYSDYIQSMKCDGVYVVGVSDLQLQGTMHTLGSMAMILTTRLYSMRMTRTMESLSLRV